MIIIDDKTKCCGCFACEQICPKQCIRMEEDIEGFFYPKIDNSICIDCGLCEKVCPVINRYEEKEEPLNCYLGKTNNESIRKNSSSGGVFSEIAMKIINDGGVVFGVKFDNNWNAVYDYTETLVGLKDFRGSKYVQANPKNAFTITKKFLKEGRKVLFSGTPCIIAGLNHFLQYKYENLITIDIVCHSIPSSKIWHLYLKEISDVNDAVVKSVTFRDKSNTWSHYSMNIVLEKSNGQQIKIIETKDKNIYMQGFLNDLYTKPCCSKCPARNYTSGSDITLADAWGINNFHPELNDEKGMSHILINTQKGINEFSSLIPEINISRIDYNEVLPYSLHLPLTSSSKANPYRNVFFLEISKGKSFISTTEKLLKKYNQSVKRKDLIGSVLRTIPFYKILLKIKTIFK